MSRRGKRNLCYADRQIIEKGIAEGKRVVQIAADVGVSRAAIYGELKRCNPYTADEAQKTLYA